MDWRWLAWTAYFRTRSESVIPLYRQMNRNQWREQKELLTVCSQRLDKLLHHAAHEVPYYRNLPREPQLADFPSLTKTDIQTRGVELHAKRITGRTWATTSSGSTGEPTRVLLDPQAHSWRTATGWRGDCFGGLKPTDRFVSFWWSSPALDWRAKLQSRLRSWLFNRHIFDSLATDANIARYLHQALISLQPAVLYGFTSNLIAYVRFARELRLKPSHALHKVMPTGEHTTPQHAAELEDYFGCPIRQRYGCAEVGDIAHQCEKGTWHIHAEHVRLEVLGEDGHIHDRGCGRLLVTCLSNFTMPLIRYDLGDIVDLTPAPCDCGRSLPTFTSIEGRAVEFVYCPNGRWISSLMFAGYFHKHEPVRHFRVIQDAPDHIHILIVPHSSFSKGRKRKLLEFFSPLLGEQMRISIEQVSGIAPLPGKKNRLVLNHLDPPVVPRFT